MPQKDPNTIAELICDIDGGNFQEGATEKLAQLVRTMKERERNSGGKPKGKIVVALNLTLDRGMIEITGDVKVTEPSTVHGRTFMYGTDQGALVKEDPRQHALALEAPVRDGVPDLRSVRGGRDRAAGE